MEKESIKYCVKVFLKSFFANGPLNMIRREYNVFSHIKNAAQRCSRASLYLLMCVEISVSACSGISFNAFIVCIGGIYFFVPVLWIIRH